MQNLLQNLSFLILVLNVFSFSWSVWLGVYTFTCSSQKINFRFHCFFFFSFLFDFSSDLHSFLSSTYFSTTYYFASFSKRELVGDIFSFLLLVFSAINFPPSLISHTFLYIVFSFVSQTIYFLISFLSHGLFRSVLVFNFLRISQRHFTWLEYI